MIIFTRTIVTSLWPTTAVGDKLTTMIIRGIMIRLIHFHRSFLKNSPPLTRPFRTCVRMALVVLWPISQNYFPLTQWRSLWTSWHVFVPTSKVSHRAGTPRHSVDGVLVGILLQTLCRYCRPCNRPR